MYIDMKISIYNNFYMIVEGQSKEDIFKTLIPLLKNESPFVESSPISQDFSSQYFEMDFPVLVIGAGGLGCQILKNLALSGFNTIHVVDLDTIDLSNLNRQFLFRIGDVGKSKAQVAADFVMKRVPTVSVVAHCCRIQELDDDFYRQFMIIIGGLDNVEARRWLNQKVHDLVEYDDKGEILPETRRVFIDGGTERFNGQVLVVKPFETSCYECITSTLPKMKIFNSCTIASTPRIPEHCIQYAKEILWESEFGDKKIDTDSKDDIRWLYNKALERAEGFGIKGVTEQLTLGVIKNIIPAIASTNCLIAAACTNEVFKLTTGTNPSLNNLYYYKGTSSTGSDTFIFQAQQDCLVCSTQRLKLKFPLNQTLNNLLHSLSNQFKITKNVFIQTSKGFLVNPVASQFDKYLSKTIQQLITQGIYQNGDKLYVVYTNQNKKSVNCAVFLELTQ